jgi:hypothetical protein
MNGLGSLLENLYRQFILRDLLAKIMPGFIVIGSTASLLSFSIRRLVRFTTTLNFWQWLLLFAFAWVIGFFVQHAGILAGILSDKTHQLERQNPGAIKEWFRSKVKISRGSNEEFRKVLERAIVIKETCGNTSMALLYTAGLFTVHFWWKLFASWRFFYICRDVMIIVPSAALVWVLLDAHHYHSRREEYLRQAFEDLLPTEAGKHEQD